MLNHALISKDLIARGLLAFALGSFVLSIFYIYGIGVEIGTFGRVSIFGDNVNAIGVRMCVSLLIMIMQIIKFRTKHSNWFFLLVFCIPSMLNLMIETGSRVAMISFSLASLVIMLFSPVRSRQKKFIFIFFGLILLLLLSLKVLQSETMLARLFETSEGDLSGRDLIWISLFPLIEDNILFGVGISGYIAFGAGLFDESYASPHNLFVEILCLTGVVGLLIYAIFLFRILRTAYASFKNDNNLLPIILFLPFFGLVLTGQVFDSKICWVILTYAIDSGLKKNGLYSFQNTTHRKK